MLNNTHCFTFFTYIFFSNTPNPALFHAASDFCFIIVNPSIFRVVLLTLIAFLIVLPSLPSFLFKGALTLRYWLFCPYCRSNEYICGVLCLEGRPWLGAARPPHWQQAATVLVVVAVATRLPTQPTHRPTPIPVVVVDVGCQTPPHRQL